MQYLSYFTMLRMQALLLNIQSLLKKRLGLSIFALLGVEDGQSMQHKGCLWMLRSHLFPNEERSLEKCFSLSIFALLGIEGCQPMQHNSYLRMLQAQQLFSETQSSKKK